MLMSVEVVSFDAANREILSNQGFDAPWLPAYDAATTLDPRLTSAEIIALPPDASPLASARPAALSESGHNQVRLALGDTPVILERFASSLGVIRGARKFFAERIGLRLSEQDITPAFLATHSFLHEFGHIGQYLGADASPDPEEFWRQAKADKNSMPLGNIAVSRLLDPNSAERQAVDANLELILEFHGAASLEELLEMQHTAYRMTNSERGADLFSAAVLRSDPILLRAVTSFST